MIIEAIGTAESVEEATEIALNELNADPSVDVQIEVVSTPKKKTLGLFGGSKASVRAYYEAPDAPKQTGKSAKSEKKEPKKAEDKPVKKAEAKKEEPKVTEPTLDFVDVESLEEGSPALNAVKYISAVLEQLGATNISMKVAKIDGGAHIAIEGEGLGAVIGRRGETLDALQYLASFASNSKENGYFRVVLNIGDYRERREQTLKSLARRMASQVLKTGRNRSLEPMNPYERRIIHTEIQNIDGVISNSIGEGQSRHVVICPEGGSPRPPRRTGGRHGRAPKKESSAVAATPNPNPKKDGGDTPLYGRIG